MPKIPTRDDLGQRAAPNAPLLQPSVVSADLTQESKAMLHLGQDLKTLGAGMTIYQNAKDRTAFVDAKATFLRRSIEERGKLAKDPDYATYGERYQASMVKAKEEAMEIIAKSNVFGTSKLGNKYKNDLQNEINLHEAQGLENLADIATKKEGDFERGNLDTILSDNSNALLQTADDKERASLMMTTNEAIDLRAARGFISQESAIKLKQNFAESFAVDRISLLPAHQQIQALNPKKGKNGEIFFGKNDNWSDIISNDKKIALLERARNQLEKDANDNVTNIKKNDFLRRRAAEDRANDIVIHGGRIEDLPIEDFVLLNQETKNNLSKTAEIYSGTIKISKADSKNALYNFLDMYHNDPDELVQTDPTKITSSLSPEDASMVMGWQQRAASGEVIPVDLAVQNKVANQVLNTMGIGPTNKKAGTFKNRYSEEVEYFKETHKKNPGLKDLQQIARSLVVEATFDGGIFGKTETVPLYKKDREDVEKEIVVPENFKKDVLTLRKQKGYTSPVSEDYFKKLYLEALKK